MINFYKQPVKSNGLTATGEIIRTYLIIIFIAYLLSGSWVEPLARWIES